MANTSKKLRLSDDKLIAGVVAGFAEYFGFDTTLARVIYAAFVVLTGFFPGVLLYLVAYAIMKHGQ